MPFSRLFKLRKFPFVSLFKIVLQSLGTFLAFFFLFCRILLHAIFMANKRTRLSNLVSEKTIRDFIMQNLIECPEQEICSFSNIEISQLKSFSIFPDSAVFRPYDQGCLDLASNI
ncbi:hypothetical protein Hanom_Chr06g00548541 [Helianthus anomalus]